MGRPTDSASSSGIPPREQLLSMALYVEGGLFVSAIALGLLLGVWPLRGNPWSGSEWAQGVLAMAPMLVLFVVFLLFPVGPLKRIQKTFDEVLLPAFSQLTPFDALWISLLAGLGEEAFFRGFLQSWLEPMFGPWPALVVAAIMFGLMHLITPTYAVIAALIGGYLGWVYMATNSLVPPLVAHGLYDFFALSYLLWFHDSGRSTSVGEADTPDNDEF
ncbi:MAG TPA: CPBP family intramembrane glutamic endopeptidase [Pirellulales bacterium]